MTKNRKAMKDIEKPRPYNFKLRMMLHKTVSVNLIRLAFLKIFLTFWQPKLPKFRFWIQTRNAQRPLSVAHENISP